ncbi:MAG: hypothetical protein AAEJ52_06195 [Myxococcota bacterium]
MAHGYGSVDERTGLYDPEGSTTFNVLPIETPLNLTTIGEVRTQLTERRRRRHWQIENAPQNPNTSRRSVPSNQTGPAWVAWNEYRSSTLHQFPVEVAQLNARIGELETLRTSSGTAANSAADLLAQQPDLRALTREAERSRAGRRDDTRSVAPGPSRDSGAQRSSEGRRATRGAPRRKRGRAARLIGGLGMPGTGSEILGAGN